MEPQAPQDITQFVIPEGFIRREDTPGTVLESRDGVRYVVDAGGAWRRPGRSKQTKKQRQRSKQAQLALAQAGLSE